MDDATRERLETAGWKVGDFADFADFIGLPDDERRMIELRVAVGIATRKLREAKGLTQNALAGRIASTQSRVSKVEEAANEVSLDLMFRAFFAAGGRLEDLASLGVPIREEPGSTVAPRPRKKRAAKQGG